MILKYGSWWAFQAGWHMGPLQLGFHTEVKSNRTISDIRYGPYVDLHLPFCVVSVGRNPIYAGELHLLSSYGKAGLNPRTLERR